MSMPEAQAKFEAAIEAALEEYMRDGVEMGVAEGGDILADWIVGYTRQKIDDEGDIVWANSMISKHGANPNGHAALAAWTADVVSEVLMVGVNDDFPDE